MKRVPSVKQAHQQVAAARRRTNKAVSNQKAKTRLLASARRRRDKNKKYCPQRKTVRLARIHAG